MMEEWHQKLHNNTTPDDVVICQALINYLRSNCDIRVYWEHLNKEGKLRCLRGCCSWPLCSKCCLVGRAIHYLWYCLSTYMSGLAS